MFLLKKIIAVFLLPPALPLLIVAFAAVIKQRWQRAGRWLMALGLIAAWLLTTPLVLSWIVSPLENAPVLNLSQVPPAQALVILGGGRRGSAEEYGGETVNSLTLERVRYGARVGKVTGLPVLLTGGAPSGGTAEAILMARALTEDFDLKPRWLESQSLDTRDNADMSARILLPLGVKKILLVTHASHMRRATAEFQRAGFEVVPAPTASLLSSNPVNGPFGILPDARAAFGVWVGLHEWLGLLALQLRG